MSSNSKEGIRSKPSDFVDTLSDAIMKIFRYSNNDMFINRCFSYLKVNNPVMAEKEIKNCFHTLLGCSKNSLEIAVNSKDNVMSFNKIYAGAPYEIQRRIERKNESTSSNGSYEVFPALECNIGSPSNHSYSQQPIGDLQKESLTSQGNFAAVTKEYCNFVHLTSTPNENYKHGNIPCEIPLESVMGTEIDYEDDLEVLRCADIDDLDYESLSEEIEFSYESLNLSAIQDITQATITDPSLQFSHPELLNESYLLRDITDLKESWIDKKEEDLDINISINNFEDTSRECESGTSSQELIDKALSNIEKSILAGIQDHSQSGFTEESENIRIYNHYTDRNDHLRDVSLLSIISKNCEEIEKQNYNEMGNAENFEANESDCVVVFDTSYNQEGSGLTQTNNNNNNVIEHGEDDDDDLIIVYETNNKSLSQDLSNKYKEILDTDDKPINEVLKPISENLVVENLEEFNEDIENNYECYFDSAGGVELENMDNKTSTDEEDLGDDKTR